MPCSHSQRDPERTSHSILPPVLYNISGHEDHAPFVRFVRFVRQAWASVCQTRQDVLFGGDFALGLGLLGML